MIVVSFLNYLMNEDHVSLGIFVFLGIGFFLISLKERFNDIKAKRINKYAMTFFFLLHLLYLFIGLQQANLIFFKKSNLF